MQTIRGIYDGQAIRPLEPIRAIPNVQVMITFLEPEALPETSATRVEDVAGCLRYSGPAKTLAEMDAAIAQGVRERWKRSPPTRMSSFAF